MKKIWFILLVLCNVFVRAQNRISIKFEPTFKQFRLEPNVYYPYLSDSIQFQELKFYIGHIQLFNNDSLVFNSPKSHYLIDIYQNQSIPIDLAKNIYFNRIKFELGVDSNTSVSGALEGDLDPSLGMYWTWQSGYIHTKIEANIIGSNQNKTPITYHLGGYQFPFNTLQKINLSLVQTETIKIAVDIATFLTQEDVLKQNNVMSPQPASVLLSDIFARTFKVSRR